MDLTLAEDIKKRWQQYTEELYKKDEDNQESIINHREPGIKPRSPLLQADSLPAEPPEVILKEQAVFCISFALCTDPTRWELDIKMY